MKTDVNLLVPSKSYKQKNVESKNLVFVGILSATDYKSRIWSRIWIRKSDPY